MPLDKHKTGTPAKPLTPSLSTAFRTSKSPLTPKLATSKTSSPTSPPRRAIRSETAGPSATSRADTRSPAAPILNGNVTPRSGARRSRTAGASPSTPDSTGIGQVARARPISLAEFPSTVKPNGAGQGIGPLRTDRDQSAPATTAEISTPRTASTGLDAQLSPTDPSATSAFLYASDKQALSPSDLDAVANIRQEPPFIYASRTAQVADNQDAPPTSPGSSLKPHGREKFFFVSDRPADTASLASRVRPQDFKSGSPSVFPPLSQSSSISGPPQTPREPSSPVKAASLQSAPATFAGGAARSRRISTTIAQTPSPQATVSSCDTPRRTSVEIQTSTVRQPTHNKVSSISSAPSTPPKRQEQPSNTVSPKPSCSFRPCTLPSSPTNHRSPCATSNGSSNSDQSKQVVAFTSSPSLHPVSPMKTSTPQISYFQSVDETAANARRERKVLDLEISNSSLLAINRTLEREMRKQSTELRRFRRLSRAGRLSATSNNPLRSTSGLSTFTESEYGDSARTTLSNCEEEVSALEAEEDDDQGLYLLDDASSSISPTSPADHDGRRCSRDENRLASELRKHQQLLVDSRKMDQSIKRCLDWTEELINEGNKALEYQVKVSDVEIGGKVLTHDRDEEEDEDHTSGNDGATPLS